MVEKSTRFDFDFCCNPRCARVGISPTDFPMEVISRSHCLVASGAPDHPTPDLPLRWTLHRTLRGRRGFTRQPENSKRAHFRAPALQTPPKFHEKTPQKREERMKIVVGGEKKKRDFLGGRLSGGGLSGRGLSGRRGGALRPNFSPYFSARG